MYAGAVADGGWRHCATNQVLYHLASRGIRYDLLPQCQQHSLPVMAYCPLAQAGRYAMDSFQHSDIITWLTRGDYGSATAARLGDSSSGSAGDPGKRPVYVVQNAAALGYRP